MHEFGHTLVFIPKHQNFGTAIPWDKEKVYAFYGHHASYWIKDAIDLNFFYKYSCSETNYSSFDRQSILQYTGPKELTTDG